MGIHMLFYIIFGTNLLTEGPVPVSVFLPISVFGRKGIPNGMKPSGELFLEQTQSRRLGVDVNVTPTVRLYLPRVEARLRGIIALKAYVAS